MKGDLIQVRSAGKKHCDCLAVVLVPDIALSELGHVRTISVNIGTQAKHEFYALAQTAYMQSQDDEIDLTPVGSPIEVTVGHETFQIAAGLVLCRRVSGGIEAFVHSDQSHQKLLDAAHRYCTRWIRLDI
jgi:hypothetical protein